MRKFLMEIPIIYEDDNLLLINKPAGIVVNRAQSVKQNTIQDWVEKNYELRIPNSENRELDQEFINRSGVVHRLDKETSGLMILAKDSQTFQKLKQEFKDRLVEKHYMALTHGKVIPKSGSVNLPLKRNPLNRRKFIVKADGKLARTVYQVQKYYSCEKQDFTLLELDLKTGRTHQIRVHLSFLGYPLVSDQIYLGKRLKTDLTWCPRLFLHAFKLAFIHPQSREKLNFEIDLPSDLNQALRKLA